MKNNLRKSNLGNFVATVYNGVESGKSSEERYTLVCKTWLTLLLFSFVGKNTLSYSDLVSSVNYRITFQTDRQN
jgi:hypothetical protein